MDSKAEATTIKDYHFETIQVRGLEHDHTCVKKRVLKLNLCLVEMGTHCDK